MGWIALSDQETQVFDLKGIARGGAPVGQADPLTPNSLLSRGTLLFETKLAADGRPRVLLSFHRAHPWISGLTIQELPSGAIALVVTQGADVFHTVLEHSVVTQDAAIRISYAWDAPRRWGRLAVENIVTGEVSLREVSDPKPLLLSDLRLMTLDPAQRQLDRAVTYLAISSAIEPVGPAPSLSAQVPVLTNFGWRAAHQIQKGDVLRVPGIGGVPVLEVVKRAVPARGSFQPIRLRAPYLGLQQDVVVGAMQRLRIGGSAVDYLFGCPEVLVPAGHLINGISALPYEEAQAVTYYQFVLPTAEPFLTAGAVLDSLFLARMRRHPDLFNASLLAGCDRARLPEHAAPGMPVLDHFEAITLAELRAA